LKPWYKSSVVVVAKMLLEWGRKTEIDEGQPLRVPRVGMQKEGEADVAPAAVSVLIVLR